jgi:hypothetical protein
MARSQKKHDRIAFIACTSLAIAIAVVMWVLSVRSVVGQGVAGTREVISNVSSTAGAVKQQSAPDPETIAAIKAGLKEIVTKQDEGPGGPVGQGGDATEGSAASDDETIDAVAQLMKHDVETYGEEPKN